MNRFWLVAAMCVSFFFAGQAHAQFPCYGGWNGGWGYGYGYPGAWQSSYSGRTPPYFALHPPVYYSGEIVRIPYGASPWAAWPQGSSGGMREAMAATSQAVTPTAVVAPQLIENPHYKSDDKKPGGTKVEIRQTPVDLKIAPASPVRPGQMILNPHYFTAEKVASR